MGKTHLLEGLYRDVRRKNPGLQVVFLTSEQFTNYFTQGLRDHSLPAFRQRFVTIGLDYLPPAAEQRVLVTGGSGFLGRAVCAALGARGAEIVVAPSALKPLPMTVFTASMRRTSSSSGAPPTFIFTMV